MLNKKDLAARLSISVSMVNKLLAKGMPHIKIGKSVRFDYDEVLTWIKERNKSRTKNSWIRSDVWWNIQ